MTTAREIAAALGVATADTITKPPARRPGKAPPCWADFTEEKRLAFRQIGPACVCVIGGNRPEPRHMGDNRGGWPVRLMVQRIWDDAPAHAADRESPWVARRLLLRLWTESREEAGRLERVIRAYLVDRAEEDGRHAWLDLGPDVDLARLGEEIQHAATRAGLHAWDDAGMSQHLDGVLALWKQGGV